MLTKKTVLLRVKLLRNEGKRKRRILRNLFLFSLFLVLLGVRFWILPTLSQEKERVSFRERNLHKRVETLAYRTESVGRLKADIGAEISSLKEHNSWLMVSDTAEDTRTVPWDTSLFRDIPFLTSYVDSLHGEFATIAQAISEGNNIFSDIPVIKPLPDSVRFYQTKSFGTYKSHFDHREQMHNGVDYTAPVGAPVIATAGGVVRERGEDSFWGKYVRIRHSQGVETFYAHLDEIFVRRGQRVSKGHRIGALGETGYSVGPHVHYEVRIQGTPVDPEAYMVSYE
ncbi:M23 family metallopeptidase [Chitinivibrio alkaliphilus]|uniref:Peptidase, M23/M37 family protein n=1 Tax=Chitinivibrio alkaliphilus ACht1 TaxID=1313304 RepID=U7D9Q3_9BACT|nr:M23 family metallopeptidase [Chitinivibrio alkaliphilus]ERP39124.1 peptidase, M23/M37 family protein [Chitinivibrio alkaliphilus ACht1]